MIQVLLLSMVCALIATTLTESTLFREVRVAAKRLGHYIGAGIGCGYCAGHWIAFALTGLYRPRLFTSAFAFVDYLATAFVIAWLSAVQWSLIVLFVHLAGRQLTKEVEKQREVVYEYNETTAE